MLINQKEQKTEKHVEFVSYTGKWPNLCQGLLTLKIDNTIVTFGNNTIHKNAQYPKFWSSGGECTMKYIQTGEWIINVANIPKEFREYAAEIDEVFNENVEHGHCGGCR